MQDYSANETSAAFAPANRAWQTYLGNGNPDSRIPGTNYYDFQSVGPLIALLAHLVALWTTTNGDQPLSQDRRLGLLHVGHEALPQRQRRRG